MPGGACSPWKKSSPGVPPREQLEGVGTNAAHVSSSGRSRIPRRGSGTSSDRASRRRALCRRSRKATALHPRTCPASSEVKPSHAASSSTSRSAGESLPSASDHRLRLELRCNEKRPLDDQALNGAHLAYARYGAGLRADDERPRAASRAAVPAPRQGAAREPGRSPPTPRQRRRLTCAADSTPARRRRGGGRCDQTAPAAPVRRSNPSQGDCPAPHPVLQAPDQPDQGRTRLGAAAEGVQPTARPRRSRPRGVRTRARRRGRWHIRPSRFHRRRRRRHEERGWAPRRRRGLGRARRSSAPRSCA